MKLDVIILGAGVGWRIKSQEPRSLLRINEKMLIERQMTEINKLKRKGADINFYAVAGYKYDKFKKYVDHLPITVIENKEYQETGQIESLRIALDEINSITNLLIIHGDMLLDWNVSKIDLLSSFILYEEERMLREKEVGVNHYDNKLNKLFYGLNPKWAQIVFLNGLELKLLREVCNTPNRKYLFTHEVINNIVDRGGCFISKKFAGKLFEIDKMKDIRDAGFNC